MGCDIRVHTEVKLGGQWHHYAALSPYRNYRLFAKMAGVRNEAMIEPIALPRGLPNDATDLTLLDCRLYGSDAHSHSWLDAFEIEKLYRWLESDIADLGHDGLFYGLDTFGDLFGQDWDFFNQFRSWYYLPEELADVRFIFWFDS